VVAPLPAIAVQATTPIRTVADVAFDRPSVLGAVKTRR
jgi:hypothetical protein